MEQKEGGKLAIICARQTCECSRDVQSDRAQTQAAHSVSKEGVIPPCYAPAKGGAFGLAVARDLRIRIGLRECEFLRSQFAEARRRGGPSLYRRQLLCEGRCHVCGRKKESEFFRRFDPRSRPASAAFAHLVTRKSDIRLITRGRARTTVNTAAPRLSSDTFSPTSILFAEHTSGPHRRVARVLLFS